MCSYLFFTIYYCFVIICLLVNTSFPNKMIYSSLKTGIILFMVAFLTLFFNFLFSRTMGQSHSHSPKIGSEFPFSSWANWELSVSDFSKETWSSWPWALGVQPLGQSQSLGWEASWLTSPGWLRGLSSKEQMVCPCAVCYRTCQRRKSLLREYCNKAQFQPLTHQLGSHTWSRWITAALIYWWEGQGAHQHS